MKQLISFFVLYIKMPFLAPFCSHLISSYNAKSGVPSSSTTLPEFINLFKQND